MKTELNTQDTELYLKIVRVGNMDDMFDFGRVIGRQEMIKETQELINKTIKS